MKRNIVYVLVLVFIVIPFLLPAQDLSGLSIFDTVNSQQIEKINTSLLLPQIHPECLSISLNNEQMVIFDKVMFWNYMAIAALGVNTASVLVAVAVDPLIGGILSLLSFTYWTISTGGMSFSYRDLILDPDAPKAFTFLPDAPPFKTGAFASLGAYAFGIGTITAIGLSFSDDTGAATTLAYICSAISSISGIIAIVQTFSYSKDVDYAAYKKQLAYSYNASYYRSIESPAPKPEEKGKYKITLPLLKYSY